MTKIYKSSDSVKSQSIEFCRNHPEYKHDMKEDFYNGETLEKKNDVILTAMGL